MGIHWLVASNTSRIHAIVDSSTPSTASTEQDSLNASWWAFVNLRTLPRTRILVLPIYPLVLGADTSHLYLNLRIHVKRMTYVIAYSKLPGLSNFALLCNSAGVIRARNTNASMWVMSLITNWRTDPKTVDEIINQTTRPLFFRRYLD